MVINRRTRPEVYRDRFAPIPTLWFPPSFWRSANTHPPLLILLIPLVIIKLELVTHEFLFDSYEIKVFSLKLVIFTYSKHKSGSILMKRIVITKELDPVKKKSYWPTKSILVNIAPANRNFTSPLFKINILFTLNFPVPLCWFFSFFHQKVTRGIKQGNWETVSVFSKIQEYLSW